MKNNEILRIYGTEYKEMTKLLLNEAKLCEMIQKDAQIGIKPNLMAPVPAEFGATTHPEIIEGIIEYLNENGYFNIKIIEGCWVGDKTEEAFEYCGFNSIRDKYKVELIDTQKEASAEVTKDGFTVNICKCVKDIDFLINVPVIKGHCQTNITCALKNMKGLIPNSEKRRFHSMGLHKPIAVLNSVIKQNFVVVDHICGDLDSEGGGNPYYSNCIMVSKDPVLTDSFTARLLGYSVDDVPYIKMAEALKVGSTDLSKLEIKTLGDCPADAEEHLPVTHSILKLKDKAEDVDTCSSCYESMMEALKDLENEGLLENFHEKIMIGQGNRGNTGEYGVGNCTALFKHFVKGCPPKSEDIYKEIKSWIENNT